MWRLVRARDSVDAGEVREGKPDDHLFSGAQGRTGTTQSWRGMVGNSSRLPVGLDARASVNVGKLPDG